MSAPRTSEARTSEARTSAPTAGAPTASTAATQPGARPLRRGPWLLTGLAVALVVAAVVALGVGQVALSPAEVVGSLLHRLGLDVGHLPEHPQGEAVLWQVRAPRIALALAVGASLGTAGALMQGVFGNPLAEPGVIGVSSGAAVAASALIVLGGASVGAWPVAGAAFVGGVGTTALVYALARRDGRTEVVTLVLTGIAITAFAGGLIALFTFLAQTGAREQIVFWQLGSLNGATWSQVAVVAPLALVGVVGAQALARGLDLLALGERAARHLGVDVERLRRTAIVLVGLLTAAAVAFAGIVAFVGLVVPHLVRMVAGPAHRVLLPASALGGALVLVLADLGARSLVAQADLPLGMLTALVGGPFFFGLLRRTRATQGGWA